MWRKIVIPGGLGSTGKRGRVSISDRMRQVAGLFGLRLCEERACAPCHDVLELTIGPGDVVLITGHSGAGKSTLLRRAEAALRQRRGAGPQLGVQRLSEISLATRLALIDTFDGPLEQALEMLSRAGLGEPRLWLRRPCELSEGEQFRYRLARFMAGRAQVLLADEFTASLDRTTARVVAWQLGRFIRGSVRTGVPRAALVATSQADIEEDLRPTRVVRMGGGACSVN